MQFLWFYNSNDYRFVIELVMR